MSMSIHERLREWGRWCRDRRGMGPQIPGCVSIESRYRSPQCWDPPVPSTPAPHDALALEVERAVRALPAEERTVVRLRFATLPRGQTETVEAYMLRLRRAARMPAWAVEDKLATGVAKLTREFSHADKLHRGG
jgi:hypothetical protein